MAGFTIRPLPWLCTAISANSFWRICVVRDVVHHHRISPHVASRLCHILRRVNEGTQSGHMQGSCVRLLLKNAE